ncbi:hypothetical protein [Bdellovibrio sp. HCB337]|uniref:hypothetical protein n=1 Tax=Bdellovibrio sp. HCB337 TaxID=3394358 RepID=UPI0039A629EC
MKTKWICMTLAGVMTFQSVGFANVDRTSGVANQSIAAAQQNMEQLKQQIAAFDKALEQTEQEILNKDNSGNVTNAITLAGTAVGVALAGLTVYFVKTNTKTGDPALFAATASVVVTAAAGLMGIVNSNQKSAADIDAAQLELEKTEKSIDQALANTTDSQQREALSKVKGDVLEVKKALAIYKEDGSDLSRNRMAARVAQFTGAVLIAGGFVVGMSFPSQRTSVASVTSMAALGLGSVASAGGVLANIVTSLQSYNSEAVLKEIRLTRSALADIKL